MEFIVLASKGEQKTYEESDCLDQAYSDADSLRAKGWRIDSIFAFEVKQDFREEYDYILFKVRDICEKQIKNMKRTRLTEFVIDDIKQEVKDALDEADINTDESREYIEFMVEECMGWDEIGEGIINYIHKRVSDSQLPTV